MHRHFKTWLLAFIAAGALVATPAMADEDAALRERVKELEGKIQAFEQKKAAQIEDSIDEYLESSSAWKSADADDGMNNVTITAAFTANQQSSLNQTVDQTIVSGDVDLGFHFNVTENLQLHITAVAASGGSASSTLAPVTLSGVTDGVGVNGNNSITGNGRAINVYEAYIVHTIKFGSGNSSFSWEIGAMDSRLRFLQNAFADNENTQFMNNLFDDPSSWLWQTNTTGIGVLGIHMWFTFGKDGMHTINAGYFNPAGAYWNNGWFALQYTLKLMVAGREMNTRVAVNLDDNNKDIGGDFTIAWGVSWDWWATEKIGVFVRINGNDTDVIRGNVVKLDWSLGGEFHIINSRPNDYFGVAIGQNVVNNAVRTGNKDELVFELYYLFGLEDGKLQVTPYIQWIDNPNGIGSFKDLWVLGLRVHVPF